MFEVNDFNRKNKKPYEIKIVFKIGEYEKETYIFSQFDLYINGKKEENVKRFAIDISNTEIEDVASSNSYTLEKFINLSKMYTDFSLGITGDGNKDDK